MYMASDPTLAAPPHATAARIIRGKRVLTSEGEKPAAIHIRGSIVEAITNFDDVPPGAVIYEAGDLVVMPGIVDTHVHINEPGRTDWEGFTAATRAAAAGGVTTLIEMPLNSVPAVTTVSAFREKLAAAAGKLAVDVGFWGGLVPENIGHLTPLWEAGVFGFKCFLVASGVDEFPSVTVPDLRDALRALVPLQAPLLVHAELPGPIDCALKGIANEIGASRREYSTWLATRPRRAENEAVGLLASLAAEFKTSIHIVHLSSSEALLTLRQARADGIAVTSETCPHYLTFASEEIPDGATEFKCAPPIRESENREKLWEALADGTIDLIATDHSPCPPAMKLTGEGDFLRAWGGIASLQIGLPAAWTQARQRGYSLMHMANWLCRNPARLARIEKRKGSIAVGCDADLVVWDPDATFRVDPERLQHRHKITPYAGRELFGVVQTTFLRGRPVYDRGKFQGLPSGQLLLRGKT